MATEGLKYDSGKPQYSRLPQPALAEVCRVLEYGARKYEWGNWAKVRPIRRYIDAAFRHLYAYVGGEDQDPESGLHHLAHAACSVLFALNMSMHGVKIDDG